MTSTIPEPIILKTDGLGRVRTSLAQREALLDAFERSGLSGMQFAALHGLKYPSFANWVLVQVPTQMAGKDADIALGMVSTIRPQFNKVIFQDISRHDDCGSLRWSRGLAAGQGLTVKHQPLPVAGNSCGLRFWVAWCFRVGVDFPPGAAVPAAVQGLRRSWLVRSQGPPQALDCWEHPRSTEGTCRETPCSTSHKSCGY